MRHRRHRYGNINPEAPDILGKIKDFLVGIVGGPLRCPSGSSLVPIANPSGTPAIILTCVPKGVNPGDSQGCPAGSYAYSQLAPAGINPNNVIQVAEGCYLARPSATFAGLTILALGGLAVYVITK